MTIVRVGSNKKFAAGWEKAFGKKSSDKSSEKPAEKKAGKAKKG